MTRFTPYAEPYDNVNLGDATTRTRMRAAARRGDARAQETLRVYDEEHAAQREAANEQRRAEAAGGRTISSVRKARTQAREQQQDDRNSLRGIDR